MKYDDQNVSAKAPERSFSRREVLALLGLSAVSAAALSANSAGRVSAATSADAFVAALAAYLGESGPTNRLTRRAYEAGIYGSPGGYDWCAVAIAVAAYDCAAPESLSRSSRVSGHVAFFRSREEWLGRISNPRRGDVIVFDWENNEDPDHIGIVESFDGSQVHTVEGNADGSTEVSGSGSCKRKSYAVNSPYIFGFGRPAFTPGSNPVPYSGEPTLKMINTIEGTVYLVTESGIAPLGDPAHVVLFSRVMNSRGDVNARDIFYQAEVDTMLGYLRQARQS